MVGDGGGGVVGRDDQRSQVGWSLFVFQDVNKMMIYYVVAY
jgi:hypothetical protein